MSRIHSHFFPMSREITTMKTMVVNGRVSVVPSQSSGRPLHHKQQKVVIALTCLVVLATLPWWTAQEPRQDFTPSQPQRETTSSIHVETIKINFDKENKDPRKHKPFTENHRQAWLNLPLSTAKKEQHRLELVHIPKTAGTGLEIAAAQAKIDWSYCHHAERFHNEWMPIHWIPFFRVLVPFSPRQNTDTNT